MYHLLENLVILLILRHSFLQYKWIFDNWSLSKHENKTMLESILVVLWFTSPGLSLRAGDRGFSPATKRVAPGYFYWKIEET